MFSNFCDNKPWIKWIAIVDFSFYSHYIPFINYFQDNLSKRLL